MTDQIVNRKMKARVLELIESASESDLSKIISVLEAALEERNPKLMPGGKQAGMQYIED